MLCMDTIRKKMYHSIHCHIYSEMDFLREIDDMLMSSTSSSEAEADERQVRHAVRRPYRTYRRSKVDDYDDVDFRKYFRLHKEAFWRLHAMVRNSIDGDSHGLKLLKRSPNVWLLVAALLVRANVVRKYAAKDKCSKPKRRRNQFNYVFE